MEPRSPKQVKNEIKSVQAAKMRAIELQCAWFPTGMPGCGEISDLITQANITLKELKEELDGFSNTGKK